MKVVMSFGVKRTHRTGKGAASQAITLPHAWIGDCDYVAVDLMEDGSLRITKKEA